MNKAIERPKSWNAKKASIQRKALKPLLFFEWCCEWTSFCLGRWAFLNVLEYVGKLGLLGALILWFYPGCQDRKIADENARKTRHYNAWQTLNSAVGKPGNGGRALALADLSADGISLRSVDLSGAQFFEPVVLTNAHLNFANLTRSRFENGSNLALSQMNHAAMDGGIYGQCDFRGASFYYVTLTNAAFFECDFSTINHGGTNRSCILTRTSMVSCPSFGSLMGDQTCSFESCSFVGAKFESSHWTSPKFINCNFAYADLTNVVLDDDHGSFSKCNLFGASNMTFEFMKWATNHGAVFTNITSHQEWISWIKR